MNPRDVPVRFSRLKKMALSPMHYQHALEERPDTDTFRKGRAVHTMVLGVGDPVVTYPGRRAGKAWEHFETEHKAAGHDILSRADHEKAQRMADAVMRHRTARDLLTKGTVKERQINWAIAGRACSSRIDAYARDYVAELKTSVSAEPFMFTRQATRLYYHGQLAWYQDALACCEPSAPPRDGAFIVAVEGSAPYPVTVLELTPFTLAQGRKLARLWFERLLVCEDSNQWPPYAQDIVKWDLPEDDGEFTLTIGGEEVGA